MKQMNSHTIGVLNGSNINMLGIREPEIYGEDTLEHIMQNLKEAGKKLNIELRFFQSNHEGAMVDFIQQNVNDLDAVILNPAAFTINGYALLDTLVTLKIPYVEVHLSNIMARREWHSKTIFAQSAIGHINGFKGYVYYLGLLALKEYFDIESSKNNIVKTNTSI